MDDGLVPCSKWRSPNFSGVLILVVVDDGLVLPESVELTTRAMVLILVVVDDGLVPAIFHQSGDGIES